MPGRPPCSATEETFLDEPLEFYDIVAYGVECWFGTDFGLTREALLALESERRARYVTDLARRHGVYTPDADARLDRVMDRTELPF